MPVFPISFTTSEYIVTANHIGEGPSFIIVTLGLKEKWGFGFKQYRPDGTLSEIVAIDYIAIGM